MTIWQEVDQLVILTISIAAGLLAFALTFVLLRLVPLEPVRVSLG